MRPEAKFVDARWGIGLLFGWYIVGYLFLAGAGSGAFLLAAAGCMVDAVRCSAGSERFSLSVQAGFFVGSCLVALAAVLLVLDLGGINRAWRVVLDPFQSVVSAGAWLVALFVLVSGVLAVAGLARAEVPRWLLWPGCVLGVFLSAGVMTYTGVLLSDMVSIDFWYTPWLTALFVASSLSTGMAVLLVVDAFALPVSTNLSSHLWCMAAWASVLEAVILAGFLASRWLFTPTAQASVGMLLTGRLAPVFWLGVVCAGVALPLAVHVAGRTVSQRAAMLTSGISVLAGGLMLRYCVIAAAQYTPLI